MSGDERDEDAGYERARIPVALRDRVEALFVEYRGYEPATFQESLSLVADLAAARIEAENDGTADAVDAEQSGTAAVEPSDAEPGDAAPSDAEPGDGAGSPEVHQNSAGSGEPAPEPVTDVSTEVVDDASDGRFAELDDAGGAAPGAAASESGDDDASSDDADGDDGAIPESLPADPESNCALCGEVHPVSVLETTIPEEADSIALVCPSCAE